MNSQEKHRRQTQRNEEKNGSWQQLGWELEMENAMF